MSNVSDSAQGEEVFLGGGWRDDLFVLTHPPPFLKVLHKYAARCKQSEILCLLVTKVKYPKGTVSPDTGLYFRVYKINVYFL